MRHRANGSSMTALAGTSTQRGSAVNGGAARTSNSYSKFLLDGSDLFS